MCQGLQETQSTKLRWFQGKECEESRYYSWDGVFEAGCGWGTPRGHVLTQSTGGWGAGAGTRVFWGCPSTTHSSFVSPPSFQARFRHHCRCNILKNPVASCATRGGANRRRRRLSISQGTASLRPASWRWWMGSTRPQIVSVASRCPATLVLLPPESPGAGFSCVAVSPQFTPRLSPFIMNSKGKRALCSS